MDLCGHTHDGQVFPGNIVIRFFWENKCGYLKKGNMHNIVTSGVGLFGPNMRVGTKSEICDVSICLTESKVSPGFNCLLIFAVGAGDLSVLLLLI